MFLFYFIFFCFGNSASACHSTHLLCLVCKFWMFSFEPWNEINIQGNFVIIFAVIVLFCVFFFYWGVSSWFLFIFALFNSVRRCVVRNLEFVVFPVFCWFSQINKCFCFNGCCCCCCSWMRWNANEIFSFPNSNYLSWDLDFLLILRRGFLLYIDDRGGEEHTFIYFFFCIKSWVPLMIFVTQRCKFHQATKQTEYNFFLNLSFKNC